jgi:hypothetical protein
MSCGSSRRHVMRLQSGIPVVSIAVVSIAVVSIAEPHHVMRLQCWVEFSRKYPTRNADPDSGTNWMCIQIRNTGGWYIKPFEKFCFGGKALGTQKFAKTFAKTNIFAKNEKYSAPCDYGSASLLSDIVILCNFNMLMKRVSWSQGCGSGLTWIQIWIQHFSSIRIQAEPKRNTKNKVFINFVKSNLKWKKVKKQC